MTDKKEIPVSSEKRAVEPPPSVVFISLSDKTIEEHRCLLESEGYTAKYFNFTSEFSQYLAEMVRKKQNLPILVLDSENKASACVSIIKAIRKNAHLSSMQVLVLRSTSQNATVSFSDTDNRTHVFPKPYVGGQLLAKIGSLRSEPNQKNAMELIPSTTEKPAKSLKTLSHIKTPGLKILVAEDNPVNQMVMKNLLAHEGIEITFTNDGRAAFEAYTQKPFDIILMDINMPVMCGEEATKAIRTYEHAQHKPRVPIIAVTANVMVGARDRYLDVGMDDYLSKPLNKAALMDLIHRHTRVTQTEIGRKQTA